MLFSLKVIYAIPIVTVKVKVVTIAEAATNLNRFGVAFFILQEGLNKKN